MNAARPQAPEVYVVEATAYRRPLQLGQLPLVCQQTWPALHLQPDVEFSVELRDGQGILNVGALHCQQEGCLTCFLAGCLQLAFCPWHVSLPAAEASGLLSFTHFFCIKNLSTSTVDLVGQLTNAPRASAVHLFHVCTVLWSRSISWVHNSIFFSTKSDCFIRLYPKLFSLMSTSQSWDFPSSMLNSPLRSTDIFLFELVVRPLP